MYKINFLKDNRNDVIRTRGLFVPNEALYQTEPHAEQHIYYITLAVKNQE